MSPSRAITVALTAVLASSVAGCGKTVTPPPPEQSSAYVALGDSFTAVAGTGPFSDRACERGRDDYPSLVARAMNLTFTDASCGGAQTDALVHAQKLPSGGIVQPQFGALDPDTQVVTLGIGLNDNKLAAYLTDVCLPKTRDDSDCQSYLALPDSSEAIDLMAKNVSTALARIAERAPKARVILVGYPRLLPATGDCPKLVPLPPVALRRARTGLALADVALKAVAKNRHVEYVDMYTASVGHDVCSAAPWVAGYKDVPGKARAFHPYKSYHEAVAAKVEALLRTKKPQA
ncbi:MAG: SGNH/GDSL hydrolase family protein [Marmoricola sp.]